MNVLPIPEPWRRRAIVIRETEIPEDWFAPDELETANAFPLAKRRNEWLLSRLAAKRLAIDRGLADDPAACRIEQRRMGDWHLSLSHSGIYAGAAIDSAEVGLDIEVVRPLNERASHFFLTEEEAEVMRSTALADRLIHFWAAKEAAWKRHGGAVDTLKNVRITLERATDQGLRFDAVETIRIGELVVALTRPIA
jgi:phosphopantetheinyl transferase